MKSHVLIQHGTLSVKRTKHRENKKLAEKAKRIAQSIKRFELTKGNSSWKHITIRSKCFSLIFAESAQLIFITYMFYKLCIRYYCFLTSIRVKVHLSNNHIRALHGYKKQYLSPADKCIYPYPQSTNRKSENLSIYFFHEFDGLPGYSTSS